MTQKTEKHCNRLSMQEWAFHSNTYDPTYTKLQRTLKEYIISTYAPK